MPKGSKPAQATMKEKFLQLDLFGAALAMGGIVCFILALQYGGQTKPWGSSVVIGLLVGFFVISILFVIWEIYQGEHAMVVPRLFAKRAIWAGSLYQFFLAGTYFAIIYYLPIYFQSIDNVSPLASGVRNIPLIVFSAFATIASGITISKIGHAMPFMVAGAALGTIAAGLFYTLDIGTSTGKWIVYQIISGISTGLAFQVSMIIAQAKSKAEDISSVTAIIFCKSTDLW
jgi:hypothetical protein